jgi:hypothetical protein
VVQKGPKPGLIRRQSSYSISPILEHSSGDDSDTSETSDSTNKSRGKTGTQKVNIKSVTAKRPASVHQKRKSDRRSDLRPRYPSFSFFISTIFYIRSFFLRISSDGEVSLPKMSPSEAKPADDEEAAKAKKQVAHLQDEVKMQAAMLAQQQNQINKYLREIEVLRAQLAGDTLTMTPSGTLSSSYGSKRSNPPPPPPELEQADSAEDDEADSSEEAPEPEPESEPLASPLRALSSTSMGSEADSVSMSAETDSNPVILI